MDRERMDVLMEGVGLDALVLTTPENVLYVSDYAREPPFISARDSNWAIYRPGGHGNVTLGVHEFELPALTQQPRSWMPDLVVPDGFRTVLPDCSTLEPADQRIYDIVEEQRRRASARNVGSLEQALENVRLGHGRIGFDDVRTLRRVRSAVPGSRCSDAREILRAARLVKTPRELDLMRTAASSLDASIAAAAPLLHAGEPVLAATRAFRRSMIAQGGWGLEFVEGLKMGDRRAGRSSPPGHVIPLSATAAVCHYWAHRAYPLTVGTTVDAVRAEDHDLTQLMCSARDVLRPGLTVAEVVEMFTRLGAGAVRTRVSSLGLEPAENTEALMSGAEPLRAGMTLVVGLSIMTRNGRTTVADGFAVTDDGCQELRNRPAATH